MTGLAAGLHATVRLGGAVNGEAVVQTALRRSVGVYPLGPCFMQPRPLDDRLMLGYANLVESDIEEGVRRLAAALRESGSARPWDATGEHVPRDPGASAIWRSGGIDPVLPPLGV